MNFDKTAVDIIMEKLHIQPVGSGYIDMICDSVACVQVMRLLAELPQKEQMEGTDYGD